MSTYAIGDIQGCYEPLCRLLDRIEFDPATDRLWLCGDLVNRGPQSLEVLRWARRTRESLVCVLGNHDIHLLAITAEVITRRKNDTFDSILAASDRDELVDWLRRQPLFHREGAFVLVHAGLLPAWTLPQAQALATSVSRLLRSSESTRFLSAYYQKRLVPWSAELAPDEQHRVALAVLTRIRVCRTRNELHDDFSGPPNARPEGTTPWFAFLGHTKVSVLDHRREENQADRVEPTVLFGHWAALGHHVLPGAVALDSGCVWGGPLTAYRLEDGVSFSVPAQR